MDFSFLSVRLSMISVYAFKFIQLYYNERKSEQAHIPYAPTLLDNAAHNEW